MIKIKFDKDKISIKGHSGYDVIGKDIVCASVSSIVITSINAIIRIDEKAISYKQDEGFIEINILKHSEIVDLLILNMKELLKELQIQYDKYIKIQGGA
ncbi:MAG: ribosomal-processing cysteine protease Prp [Bacilli bacterium]|jgi:uncharacterized protein YsxB (DUF464 family)